MLATTFCLKSLRVIIPLKRLLRVHKTISGVPFLCKMIPFSVKSSIEKGLDVNLEPRSRKSCVKSCVK